MTKRQFILPLAATLGFAAAAYGQTCLLDEYNKVQRQKLNCTANDVRIAQVTNIRDPTTGKTITTCFQGSTFSFLADFEVLTTSSQARENIGLYIATNSTTQAQTGACIDNIISPPHTSTGASCTPGTFGCFGSDNYHETDAAPDNCGDTASGDFSPTFGTGAEKVTLEIDNFMCTAPAGSSTLVLPNCTSWQIPGGTIQCVANTGTWAYPLNGPGGTPTAIPGSPSKCNCSVISLPVTPVSATAIVQKACTTTNTPGPATFTQTPNTTQSPTTCDAGPEGSQVTYTVSITNTSTAGGLVIDQVCDSQYGTISRSNTYTGSACAAGTSGITAANVNCPPGPLQAAGQAGATGTCSFTATVGENVSGLTDTVTASGHSAVNTSSTFSSSSNSVTVTSTDAPSTATSTKGFVATEAACATVRYSVAVKNTSSADETLTLSALNDDGGVGDITTVHGSVLGTTCGVANGAGTLLGTAGAGALPQSISPGNTYNCQFDAQFCSAVDNNTCISNTDKVTATLAADEAADTVSETANSLTVKECLTSTVTSQ